jgi:predicted PurR-regulated permease PerM
MSSTEFDRTLIRVRNAVHATVFGTLAVAVVQGVLGGLMFWVLGLPSPLLWGAVMMLLGILPLLGTFVVWLPAAAILISQGSWGKGLALAVWGLLVVSLIDNLLYPMLVGKELHLHTLAIFFAIVGGAVLFGASGIILGPVTLAVTAALLDIWQRRMGTNAGNVASSPGEFPA